MNRYAASAEATADKDGNMYLLVGIDSGFEGTTSYYISKVSLSWEEKADPACDAEYVDMQEAASWAKAPVCSLKVLEIMTESGDGFCPKRTYTCEESVYSVVKMYRFLNK